MFLRHVPLHCELSRVESGESGDKRTRAHAFPGTISTWKVCSEEIRTHASPGSVEKVGADAHLGEAAKDRENAGAGAALKRDLQLEQMRGRAYGESTAARMRTVPLSGLK
jgi:hypothetical protein